MNGTLGESITSTWSDASPEQLLAEVFGPLIRLLLRNGIAPTLIQEAVDEAMQQTPPASDAHEAVRLGSQQRDCMEVMCRWRRDKDFLGGDGLPRDIAIDGSGASFRALCAAAGVKSDVTPLFETLLKFGAIGLLPNGHIRPLTPTFLLGTSGNGIPLDGLIKQLAAFLRVVDHNSSCGETGARPRFERICTVAIARELLPVFERTVRERGQEFIDGLDEWLERHQDISSSAGMYQEVGAGAYFVDLGNVKRQ